MVSRPRFSLSSPCAWAPRLVGGLLSALPALVYVLWFIPAGRLVESRSNVKAIGLVNVFLLRLQYLLIPLLPLLPAPYRIPALLVIVMLAGLPLCVANVAFTNVIADVVPPPDRPRVVSNRSILMSLTTALAAYLAGEFLDRLPLPANYQVLFLVAFSFSMLSLFLLSRIVVDDTQATASFSMKPRQFIEQIRDMVDTVRGTPEFMRFTLAAFVLHWGMVFAWPLFTLWWVNGLKASEGLIGLISLVNMTAIMIASPIWARIIERRGSRFALLVGFAGLATLPLMNALLPRPELILITEAIGGLIVPASNLGLFNTMLEVCPVARRPAYIAFYSAAVNIPMFLAPILATSIAAPLLGVQVGLASGSLLRLMAWVIVFMLLRKRV